MNYGRRFCIDQLTFLYRADSIDYFDVVGTELETCARVFICQCGHVEHADKIDSLSEVFDRNRDISVASVDGYAEPHPFAVSRDPSIEAR